MQKVKTQVPHSRGTHSHLPILLPNSRHTSSRFLALFLAHKANSLKIRNMTSAKPCLWAKPKEAVDDEQVNVTLCDENIGIAQEKGDEGQDDKQDGEE